MNAKLELTTIASALLIMTQTHANTQRLAQQRMR